MKEDILLYWLTHVGGGSWSQFKRTVDTLFPDGAGTSDIRGLPVLLSELGFVSLFVDGSTEWLVRPPALIGLTSLSGNVALCGARTEQLVNNVLDIAENLGCTTNTRTLSFGIKRIIVGGSEQQFTKIAQACGISYQPNYSLRLSRQLPSIFDLIDSAPRKSAPQNWTVSSFDLALDNPRWVEEFNPGSACKYTRGYGRDKYLLHIEAQYTEDEKMFKSLDRQEAVFASSALKKRELASYDATSYVLKTHAQATLPSKYAQAACLCAFEPSVLQSSWRIYRQVHPIVAYELLALLGQSLPNFYELPLSTNKRKRSLWIVLTPLNLR